MKQFLHHQLSKSSIYFPMPSHAEREDNAPCPLPDLEVSRQKVKLDLPPSTIHTERVADRGLNSPSSIRCFGSVGVKIPIRTPFADQASAFFLIL